MSHCWPCERGSCHTIGRVREVMSHCWPCEGGSCHTIGRVRVVMSHCWPCEGGEGSRGADDRWRWPSIAVGQQWAKDDQVNLVGKGQSGESGGQRTVR